MGSVADPCDESLPKLSVVDAGFSIEDGIEEAVGDVGCELSRPDLLGDDTGGSLAGVLDRVSALGVWPDGDSRGSNEGFKISMMFKAGF